MILKEEHIVPENTRVARLSDYLPGIFISLNSRKGCKKAIEKGLVSIDEKTGKTGDYIKSGMKICLFENEDSISMIYKLKLTIVFCDSHIAVVIKPPGVPVSGNIYRSVQNALPFNIDVSEESDALPIPRPTHRLDNLTGGLLLIARTRKVLTACNKLFEEKKVIKKYVALIIGKTAESGYFDSAIDGKSSYTRYILKDTFASRRFGNISRIVLFPETGRTHQLRIHLAENGTPILGEYLYGKEIPNLTGNGLFLFANEIEFQHPMKDDIVKLSIEEPRKFEKILNFFTEKTRQKD